MSGLPAPGGLVSSRPIILRRLTRLSHMDFEMAIWELGTLLIVPRKVYRDVYYRRQTKNTWARDDPAVVILQAALLIFSGIAWAIVKQFTPLRALGICLLMVLRDFLLVSLLSASAIWLCTNTLLASRGTDSKMEWAYAFDLQCNGFVALFSWLYVLQLFLLPVVTGHKWISILAGNTLYFVAFVQYFYIVYLGISALPFVRRATLFLAPLFLLFIGYVVSLSGYNVPRHILEIYFD